MKDIDEIENKNKQEPYYFLYIIRNGETDEYKIGITNNLNRRFKEIQTGCPNAIHLIKIYSHYHKTVVQKYERVLHRYYQKCGCRIRTNGEWFKLTKADIIYLCKPQTIDEQNNLIKDILKMM